MTQADSVLSTPPTNTSAITPSSPSRRGFLAQAAGVAAGSAVLIGGSTVAAPAMASHGGPDPIFAAIEAHRRANEATNALLREHSDLEEKLPKEISQSRITAWEEKIVETDAPEWIASERALMAAHDAEIDAALELASVSPKTTAGAAAILAYVVEYPDRFGSDFPEFADDDGITRPFEHFIIQNCAAALAKLSAAA